MASDDGLIEMAGRVPIAMPNRVWADLIPGLVEQLPFDEDLEAVQMARHIGGLALDEMSSEQAGRIAGPLRDSIRQVRLALEKIPGDIEPSPIVERLALMEV